MCPWSRSDGTGIAGDVEATVASHPRWLQLVRVLVEQCGAAHEIGDGSIRDVVVAVGEAVSNVMRHAYGGERTQPIGIVCRCRQDAFEVEIWDRGAEFDPFVQDVPPPGELRYGGRGLFLMRSLVDETEYAREGGWNRIRLRKRLPVLPARK